MEGWKAGEGSCGGDGLIWILLDVGLDDVVELVGDGAGEKEIKEDVDVVVPLLGEGLKLSA